MLPEPTPKLTTTDLLQLLEEARNAELCRDIDSLRTILQTVWNEENGVPTFAEYESAIRAELLRLCGFFLTFYGRSRNLRDYQLKAKDVLTNATEIFQLEGLADKAAESKIILAFCYWNCGEVSECEALLGLVENEFNENKIHPVYLQIKINRMMLLCWCEKFDEAFDIINEISFSIDYCKDTRLRILFNFEAAILFHRKLKYEDAISHFSESIRLAKGNGNFHLLALTYNNLSLLYRDMKRFDEAHDLSIKSFDILKKLNHVGWMPHILDSKALIYLDENKYKEALDAIEEALTYFYEGEDYKGLTAALWTKVRCLLRLGHTKEAVLTFTDLKIIAAERIGEVAVDKFTESFIKEIYVLRHLPFADEIAEFKKARVSAALNSSGGKIGDAAKILGLKNHQALSDILNKQFPELLSELGFKRRARRTPEKQPAAAASNSAETSNQRKIYRLILTDKHFSFDFKLTSPQFEVFYFDKYVMREFGGDSSALVAVVPVKKLKAGMPVLAAEEDGFSVGITEYDEWMGIYFISDAKGDPLPIDKENIAGEAIGFCSFAQADNQFIQFSRFRF